VFSTLQKSVSLKKKFKRICPFYLSFLRVIYKAEFSRPHPCSGQYNIRAMPYAELPRSDLPNTLTEAFYLFLLSVSDDKHVTSLENIVF
jgi:hypothetical protein